jgi:hypothetical protein
LHVWFLKKGKITEKFQAKKKKESAQNVFGPEDSKERTDK